ncbi:protein of unknown function [Paraburkholderia dioscoreae]|uniref:Uncharacterized protein n=1 Tax=Paraburkholderia dioscoreae TaxID=2604047 RepID=A0A5Q4Z248_9BURK|nr:protein of unknown function [Paraburkholderia dioscoreae]
MLEHTPAQRAGAQRSKGSHSVMSGKAQEFMGLVSLRRRLPVGRQMAWPAGKTGRRATGYGDDQGCSGRGGRVVHDGIARGEQLAAGVGRRAREGRTRYPSASLCSVGGGPLAEGAVDGDDRARRAEHHEPVFRGTGARDRGRLLAQRLLRVLLQFRRRSGQAA